MTKMSFKVIEMQGFSEQEGGMHGEGAEQN
jgi:hypothetical protein